MSLRAYPTLTGQPPTVIAHRGASGYLPEHTLAAYQLAIEQGTDFIEPDLVATLDGVLIARHEPNLLHTTNISELAVFADRRTQVVIDGIEQEGFFCHHFTLAEIKQLRARQPHPYRNQSYNDRFEIPTLSEIIDLVQHVEATTGRKIGIYPETKHPTYFAQLGLALEERLITTLVAQRFTAPDRVWIQSFEVTNLKDTLPSLMRIAGIQLPLVQLFGPGSQQPYDFVVNYDPRTYADLLMPDRLDMFVSSYASAIGVWKRNFVLAEATVNGSERLTGEILPLVSNAHAAGLQTHVYTFRNEAIFLATTYAGDPIAEYQQFYTLGVDGVFSDFPDTARQAMAAN
ncbi:MAG: glycerophosphodiester phosphodiesterase family protein [Leptolyngbya sp. IPPAS B-1204]|nr:glycerophosphodiester phosphodiesterase [Elainella sp. C42_A2020_010]RNJ68103.1 MAG: glycerophosphodiester phosphodiesterase [Leptolyngbya sp. IPPAS B-1204]